MGCRKMRHGGLWSQPMTQRRPPMRQNARPGTSRSAADPRMAGGGAPVVRATSPAAVWMRAIIVLTAMEGGRPADRALGDLFAAKRTPMAERADIAEIVQGIIRLRGQLDWWLAHLHAPIDPRHRLIAFMALVAGMKADDIDDTFGRHPDLPPLDRDETQLARALTKRTLFHPNQPPGTQANVPEWILPLMEARFGANMAEELTALARPAGLDIRINALMLTRESAANALKGDGIRAQPTPLSPWGLRVSGRPPIARSRAYQKGLVEVQDEGSQLVAFMVGAKPGERVLDLCAGACGKSLAMAVTMENKGRIVACDIHDRRLADAAVRLRRADVHNVNRRLITGARDTWLDRHKADFDRVLVDAPCTGTGTWRRNPDAKWRLVENDLVELVVLQASLIDAGARAVRPGGRLVYATCSVLAAENAEQITAFLARNPAFEVQSVTEVWGESLETPCPVTGPFLELSPARHGTDGFFAAVLVRKGPAPVAKALPEAQTETETETEAETETETETETEAEET